MILLRVPLVIGNFHTFGLDERSPAGLKSPVTHPVYEWLLPLLNSKRWCVSTLTI